MPPILRNASAALLLGLGLQTSLPAHAGQPSTFTGRPVDFAVYATQTRSSWNSDDRTYDVRVDEVGFRWIERFSNGIGAGLRLGYSGISDNGRPELAGISQNGGHLGLVVNAVPLQAGAFSLTTLMDATYRMTSGSNSQRKVENDWATLTAGLSGHLRMNSVRLSLGADYQVVSGTERISGDINSTRHFSADQPLTGTAGIDLLVGGGRIGLHGETGGRNSYSLTFSRDF
ncbi:MAG: hypothetical protein D6717_13355 [Gammaproteobacteria bacterium]|nr:MAG: hypothetical protein D6717_13355 [Gammaproteobacteria bacterium]